MSRRYILVGGTVRSRMDGQVHYVGPRRLAELYHLDPRECWEMTQDEYERESRHGLPRGVTVLGPRDDGNYQVPGLAPTPERAAVSALIERARQRDDLIRQLRMLLLASSRESRAEELEAEVRSLIGRYSQAR